MTPLCETLGLRPSISQPCHIHGGLAHIVLTALLLHGLFVIKLFVWHRTAVRYFLECYHLFNSSEDIRSSASGTWGGAEYIGDCWTVLNSYNNPATPGIGHVSESSRSRLCSEHLWFQMEMAVDFWVLNLTVREFCYKVCWILHVTLLKAWRWGNQREKKIAG